MARAEPAVGQSCCWEPSFKWLLRMLTLHPGWTSGCLLLVLWQSVTYGPAAGTLFTAHFTTYRSSLITCSDIRIFQQQAGTSTYRMTNNQTMHMGRVKYRNWLHTAVTPTADDECFFENHLQLEREERETKEQFSLHTVCTGYVYCYCCTRW